VEINTDPKIGTNTIINTNIKMVLTNWFFIFHTHQKKFGQYYINSDQNVGHEDGKVESIWKSPNFPSKFGYSQQILNGEAECMPIWTLL
jgi:hypothetical protein